MDKRYIVIRIPRLDGYKTIALHIGVLLFGWANLAVLYAFESPWLLDWFASWLVVAIAAASIGLRLATDRPAFSPAAPPHPVGANAPYTDGAIYRGSTPHPDNFSQNFSATEFSPENFSQNFEGTQLSKDYVPEFYDASTQGSMSDFVGPAKGEWRRNFSQELDDHLRSRRSAIIPARQAGRTAHLRAVDLPPDPEYTPPIEGSIEGDQSGERTVKGAG